MRALPVTILEPPSPVLAGPSCGPPLLQLRIDGTGIELRGLRCFVQGENSCRVEPVAGSPGEELVTADHSLSGRRNKYTLTAQGIDGTWYWFSQPWFHLRQGGSGD